jgi:hypothetical protein
VYTVFKPPFLLSILARRYKLGVCTCTDVMRIFAVDPEHAEGRARLTW